MRNRRSGVSPSSGAKVAPMLALTDDLAAAELQGGGRRAQDPGDHPFGRAAIDVAGQHERELVTTEAGQRVGTGDQGLHPPCQLAEHRIAYRMAERVVHVLGVVEIEQDEGHPPAGLADPRQGLSQTFD